MLPHEILLLIVQLLKPASAAPRAKLSPRQRRQRKVRGAAIGPISKSTLKRWSKPKIYTFNPRFSRITKVLKQCGARLTWGGVPIESVENFLEVLVQRLRTFDDEKLNKLAAKIRRSPQYLRSIVYGEGGLCLYMACKIANVFDGGLQVVLPSTADRPDKLTITLK